MSRPGNESQPLVQKYNLSVLGDYKTYVDQLFAEESGFIISNGLPEHAAALVSTMFRKAKKEMVIFCHDLNAKIYSEVEVIRSIVEAANRGVSIRIVTQVAPQAIELLCKLRNLAKVSPELVQLKRCAPDSVDAALGYNFAVMDTKAFRYEPDRSTIKADACANNPPLAQKMLNAFNRLFDNASPDDQNAPEILEPRDLDLCPSI